MKNIWWWLLAYDRLCTFEFGCTVELFALERPELEVDWYDFAVCAIEDGPIRAAGGITVPRRTSRERWRRPIPS
jgi:transcriptional regulator GlxA family with amidase domain